MSEVSPLLKRLQPLLAGVQSAEDFIQDILKHSLTQCAQRICDAEKIPMDRIRKHMDAVLGSMQIVMKTPAPLKQKCRGLTRKKTRCKRNSQWPTEFCASHTVQREAHQKLMAAKEQMLEHDALMRARQRKDHNHEWNDEEGYVQECPACAETAPAKCAISYSGQSIPDTSDVTSRAVNSAAKVNAEKDSAGN